MKLALLVIAGLLLLLAVWPKSTTYEGVVWFAEVHNNSVNAEDAKLYLKVNDNDVFQIPLENIILIYIPSSEAQKAMAMAAAKVRVRDGFFKEVLSAEIDVQSLDELQIWQKAIKHRNPVVLYPKPVQ